MLTTEEEAKKKLCPFLPQGAQIVDGEYHHIPIYGPCLGSGCMAWEWSPLPYGKRPADHPGYCGRSICRKS